MAPAERVLLEQHLRACPLCRALTAGLARAQGRVAPVPPVAVAPVGAPPATPAKRPSLWWVPLVTHAVLALLVGAAAWWLLGRHQ